MSIEMMPYKKESSMLSFRDELAAQTGLSERMGRRALEAFGIGDTAAFWTAAGIYDETRARIESMKDAEERALMGRALLATIITAQILSGAPTTKKITF